MNGRLQIPKQVANTQDLDMSKNPPILSVLVLLIKLLTPRLYLMLNMETSLQVLSKEPKSATNLLPLCLTGKRIPLDALHSYVQE